MGEIPIVVGAALVGSAVLVWLLVSEVQARRRSREHAAQQVAPGRDTVDAPSKLRKALRARPLLAAGAAFALVALLIALVGVPSFGDGESAPDTNPPVADIEGDDVVEDDTDLLPTTARPGEAGEDASGDEGGAGPADEGEAEDGPDAGPDAGTGAGTGAEAAADVDTDPPASGGADDEGGTAPTAPGGGSASSKGGSPPGAGSPGGASSEVRPSSGDAPPGPGRRPEPRSEGRD